MPTSDHELEKYTLARVLYSEASSHTPQEKLAVGWSVRNKARQKFPGSKIPITLLIAGSRSGAESGDGYGKQGDRNSAGRKRPFASTRWNPAKGAAFLDLADSILRADQSESPIGNSGTMFEPELQDRLWCQGKIKRNAAEIEARWTRGGRNIPLTQIGRWRFYVRKKDAPPGHTPPPLPRGLPFPINTSSSRQTSASAQENQGTALDNFQEHLDDEKLKSGLDGRASQDLLSDEELKQYCKPANPRAANPGNSGIVVKFHEEADQVYYCDYQVWVAGVDVSTYISGPLSVSYVGNDGVNSVSFQLQNAGIAQFSKRGDDNEQSNNFILSRRNLRDPNNEKGSWRKGTLAGDYSEAAKYNIFRAKYTSPENRPDQAVGNFHLTADDQVNSGGGGARTWPLDPDRPIFHKHDPLLVWFHDPLHDPTRVKDGIQKEVRDLASLSPEEREKRLQDEEDGYREQTFKQERWLPLFTGYVNTYPWKENYITGESDISVSGYCIRALMQRMRVLMNPVSLAASVEAAEFDQKTFLTDGFFRDITAPIRQKDAAHPFARQSLEEIVAYLICGDILIQEPGTGSFSRQVGDAARSAIPTEGIASTLVYSDESPSGLGLGVGDMRLGTVGGDLTPTAIPLPTDKSALGAFLERWHGIALTGSYLHDKGVSRYWYTRKEVKEISSQSGTLSAKWNPSKRKLYILVPPGGTQLNKLYATDVVNTQAATPEWETRYNLVNNTLEKIGYTWFVSPFGDIFVEFPLIDYSPSDFSRSPSNPSRGYRQHFTFDKHIIEASYDEEAGDIPTALQVTGAFSDFTNIDAASDKTIARAELECTFLIKVLARRLGVNMHQAVFPFITANGTGDPNLLPQSAGGIDEDSLKRRLFLWGLIELQKLFANTSTVDLTIGWRPWVLPNRPVYSPLRHKHFLLQNVTHTLQFNDAAQTQIAGHYVRNMHFPTNLQGEIISDTPVPMHITGAPSMPLSFRLLNETVQLEFAGIKSSCEENTNQAENLQGLAAQSGARAALENIRGLLGAFSPGDAAFELIQDFNQIADPKNTSLVDERDLQRASEFFSENVALGGNTDLIAHEEFSASPGQLTNIQSDSAGSLLSGQVIGIKTEANGTKTVTVRDDNGVESTYSNLSQTNVFEGQTIGQGQTIGSGKDGSFGLSLNSDRGPTPVSVYIASQTSPVPAEGGPAGVPVFTRSAPAQTRARPRATFLSP